MNPAFKTRALAVAGLCLIGLASGGLLMTAKAANSGAGPLQPLQGQWAGDRLQLVIDKQGAHVESDCASGRFAGPVTTDAEGRFTAQGSFESHGGGPQRADVTPPASVASYRGELRDGVLKLWITPAGAGDAQTYTLVAGARIKRIRCL